MHQTLAFKSFLLFEERISDVVALFIKVFTLNARIVKII